jgi:hypothetical protein
MNVVIDDKFYLKVAYMEDIMFHLSRCHEDYYDCSDFESRVVDALSFASLLKTREKEENENWRENVNIQFRNAICDKIKHLLLHKIQYQLLIEPEIIESGSDFRQRVEQIERIIRYDICKSSLEYYNYSCLYDRTNTALIMVNNKTRL